MSVGLREIGLVDFVKRLAPPGWIYSVVQLWDHPEPAIFRLWEKAPESEWLLLVEVEGINPTDAYFKALQRIREIAQERRGR